MVVPGITDMWDPTTWVEPGPCRIYDPDMERFALVDAEFYPQLVTMPATRYGGLRTRRWYINPPHPTRNGKKLYFVSKGGWRTGKSILFLHVEVMRLSGRLPPSPRHKIVDHLDGDEWNCQLSNLEWATHVKNRRTSKMGYNRPEAP